MREPLDRRPGDANELLSAAMTWMTEHALCGEPYLCQLIVQKLAALDRLPDPQVPPALRHTCRQMLRHWADLAQAYADLDRLDAPGEAARHFAH